MLSINYSITIHGIDAIMVDVEVDSRNGLAGQTIVGLPDTAVKESKERVLSALKNSGFSVPANKYLTVNLAPADLKKVGTIYDLPIALGILQSTEQIPASKYKVLLAGELGLDGTIKPINGALQMAILAKEKNFDFLIIPEHNITEISIIKDVKVIVVSSLLDAIKKLSAPESYISIPSIPMPLSHQNLLDFADIKGQQYAKRAMEIAATGGHNIFLLGTPGCGKSMLANRLPSILPDLNEKELLEVVKIYSASGKIKSKEKTLKQKPFRSPHHTISYAGIIGGTANAKPGEISLAHNGVLFLDEIPEFSRQVLEALRQPLEDGKVSIARAGSSFTYPAEFMLVASANPCPCGYSNHPTIPCKCNENRKKQYMQKISGPLIDRFDMLIEMIPLTETEILSSKPSEKSAQVKDRIEKALAIQHLRYGHLNARMTVKEIDKHCELNKECLDILKKFYQSKKLTARSIHKVLKVARTIADMQSATSIELSHVLEAMQYRMNINNG